MSGRKKSTVENRCLNFNYHFNHLTTISILHDVREEIYRFRTWEKEQVERWVGDWKR